MTRPAPLSFGSIPWPAFGRAAQHLDAPTGAPPRLTTKADRRYMRAATLVFEGSANLRTNGNREQLTAIRDAELCHWHSAWIDSLVNARGEEAKKEV